MCGARGMGGMNKRGAEEPKCLRGENARMKRFVADAELEKD